MLGLGGITRYENSMIFASEPNKMVFGHFEKSGSGSGRPFIEALEGFFQPGTRGP